MAVYSIKKVLSLPAEASTNTVYYVKGEADSRVKLYVTDTAGTVFPVGILDGTDVLSTLLSGYSVGSDIAISSADSILQAFQKVQGQLNALSTSVSQGMKVPLPLDCSTEPNYPVAEAGDSYKVTVAGKIGGASGIIVQVGDLITASTDNGGGTQAAVGSQWFILQANTDNATESVTGLTRIATSAEVTTGSEAFAYVTPLRLKGRLDLKQDTITGGATTITTTDLTANRALISSGSGKVAVSAVTATELGYVSGASSNLQTQLNALVSAGSGYVPTARTLTINGTTQDLTANRTWNVGTVTSVALTVPTGLSITGTPITTSGTFAIGLQSGYSIPTTAKQIEWDSAYTNRITSLTVTGSSGAATLISNVLNIPTYTLSGLGGVSGTGVSGQVAFFNGTGSIAGDGGLLYEPVGNVLTMLTTANGIGLMITNTLNDAVTKASNYGLNHYLSAEENFVGLRFATDVSSNVVNIGGGSSTNNSATLINFITSANNATLNGTTRWSILSDGILQSNGAQTIQTSTGILTLQPSGSFTTGINATANINIYSASGTGVIRNTVANGIVGLFGGDASANGGNILLYGPTHATLADTIEFRIGVIPQLSINSTVVDLPTNYLQARGGITNTALGNSPLTTGSILTYTLTNGGSGYVNGIYTNVQATSIGSQQGALFDITVVGGIVTVATLKNGGRRYFTTTQLTIVNTALGGTGSGLIITIDTVQGADMYLANVNGSTIRLERTDSTADIDDVIGQILFTGLDTSVFANGDRAAIIAKNVSTNGGGYFDFEVSAAGVGPRYTALRLTNSGAKTVNGTNANPSLSFIDDTNTGLYSVGADIIGITTAGALRWSVLADGTLESNGAKTIQTSTGQLNISTAGGNGNIVFVPNGTGIVRADKEFLVNALGTTTTVSTDTLKVNGFGIMGNRSALYFTTNHATGEIVLGNNGTHNTNRIATFSSNGTNLVILNAATTDTDRFLVSDSGIIKYRTGTQLLSDIGGQVARTIQSTAGTIDITNGDGVSGNPNIEMQWLEVQW